MKWYRNSIPPYLVNTYASCKMSEKKMMTLTATLDKVSKDNKDATYYLHLQNVPASVKQHSVLEISYYLLGKKEYYLQSGKPYDLYKPVAHIRESEPTRIVAIFRGTSYRCEMLLDPRPDLLLVSRT